MLDVLSFLLCRNIQFSIALDPFVIGWSNYLK